MKKYSKIHRLGHDKNRGILKNGELTIVEKMDGANFRFQLDDETGRLLFGSRNVEFKEGEKPFPAESGEINRNFRKVCQTLDEQVDKEEIKKLEDKYGSKLTFFGENMVKHSLEYDWENIPIFLGFDVYMEDGEEYIHSFEEIQTIFERIGLETVEKVETIEDASPEDLKDYEIPESEWRDGKGEGVVIRNETMAEEKDYESSSEWKAKMVSEEFEEKNEETFGKRKYNISNDTEEVVRKYCTEARIEKHINKLVIDEDRELAMKLMEDLPMYVVEDIWEEEYPELVRSNYNIDMKKFRKFVAKRCVSKLKRRIRNAAINAE